MQFFLGVIFKKYVFYQHDTPKISIHKTENNTSLRATPLFIRHERKKRGTVPSLYSIIFSHRPLLYILKQFAYHAKSLIRGYFIAKSDLRGAVSTERGRKKVSKLYRP